MRIAYVGNFTQRHCTEVHIAATLRDMGHDVTEIQENGEFDQLLVDMVIGHDLFLFTRTWNSLVTLEDLRQLKELGIKTASYHLDLYVGLKREEGLDHDPFWRTEYVFSPDGDPRSAEVFKRKGINHFYMRPGVYKKECYIHEPSIKNKLDVVFVGGGTQYGHKEWPYRAQLVKFLESTYRERYHKFGWPEKTVRNEQLNMLYADSKVVIGDSVCIGFNHENYWSDRVFETTGRGGFIIHPYIKGLEECFIEGKEIVFYDFGNFNQLREKIDWYLGHDEEREAIRLAGHERTKRDHTYHNRLAAMFEVLNG